MTEIKSSESFGKVQIADEVIAVIAGTAALEVDGVLGMNTNFTGGIAEKMLGHKSMSKGVKVDVSGDTVSIEMNVSTKFGCKIHETAEEVQSRVKNAVETMTGLNVKEVSIVVTGVHIEKEDSVAKQQK